jgi:AcrR family transcriptional regulator
VATRKRSKSKTKSGRNSRQDILEAAMHLFAERGYHGTSMREIAKDAGVALGLVTQFYGTKDALHAAVDDYLLTQISNSVAGFAEEQNFFEKNVEASVDYITHHQDQYRYMRRALVEDSPGSTDFFRRYQAMQINLLQRAKRVGTVAEDVDESWAALTMIFLVLGPYFCMNQIEAITGTSVFDAKSIRKRNSMYARLLQRGFGPGTGRAAVRASRSAAARTDSA